MCLILHISFFLIISILNSVQYIIHNSAQCSFRVLYIIQCSMFIHRVLIVTYSACGWTNVPKAKGTLRRIPSSSPQPSSSPFPFPAKSILHPIPTKLIPPSDTSGTSNISPKGHARPSTPFLISPTADQQASPPSATVTGSTSSSPSGKEPPVPLKSVAKHDAASPSPSWIARTHVRTQSGTLLLHYRLFMV